MGGRRTEVRTGQSIRRSGPADRAALAKLSCWAHLDEDAYQKAVIELVADILLEHRDRAASAESWCVDHIRRQDPKHRLVTTKRSPCSPGVRPAPANRPPAAASLAESRANAASGALPSRVL
jgi:hypothetical protein